MTDEEFVFRQTERERKRDGRGTFNKKRQGGKVIRFPSDNLSAKERKKMNGAVKSYDFSRPMAWADFIRMPDDLCQEYLNVLSDKYEGLSAALVAESMGVDIRRYGSYFSRHNLKVRGGRGMKREAFYRTESGKRWVKWLSGNDEPVEEVAEEPVTEEVKEVVEEVKTEVKADVKANVNVQNIATLLQMLQGTGAKLTIEISL